jgi:hypothetical protein
LRLGDLLLRVKITEADLTKALNHQAAEGGRVGEHLVAVGAIQKKQLEAFIHRIPPEPSNLAATGIEESQLLALLMNLIYAGRLETNRQIVDAIKLPYVMVMDLVQMAVDRQLLRTLGSNGGDGLSDLRYVLTEAGRVWTIDALERLHYVGPAPVTLEQFTEQVSMQKLTNEIVSLERIRASFAGLTLHH